MKQYDVLVFSLFGRNTWLAGQLSALGLKVAFFDMTSLFQKGLAEDWEGPFPLIFTDSMARSYSQSLTEQDNYEVLVRGPSFRVKGKGLLEFKADHARFLTHKWEQLGLWFFEEDKSGLEAPRHTEYKSLWLKYFLKQWRSSVLNSLGQASTLDIPEFPLNSHYVVRHVSRRGFMENSAWLREVGVDVLPISSWWKCQFDKSEKQWSFQVESEETEIKAKQLILGLTSYELHRFSGQFEFKQNEVKIPKAFWTRWKAQCSGSADKLDYVPTYSMFLSDIEMGLCNENLITVIKRPDKQLDIWACLTTEVLSQQSFQDNVQEIIKKRIKEFVPEFYDLEFEGLRLGSDLYSFWPLYESHDKAPKDTSAQLIYDNPESWPALDNYSRYIYQSKIIDGFKQRLEAEASKGARKGAQA